MDLLEVALTGPVIPATLLFAVIILWSLLAIVGAVNLDAFDFDVDLDLDMDIDTEIELNTSSVTDGVGIVALKWLNIGGVPFILWIGILAMLWWGFSAALWVNIDVNYFSPNWLWSPLLALKNLVIAVLLTKLITGPMKHWFKQEKLSHLNLIGKECTISSSEATPEFGLVKFKTDGAPLLLNVRTDGPHLVQGTPVWITHYDARRRVYIVSPTTTQTNNLESVAPQPTQENDL